MAFYNSYQQLVNSCRPFGNGSGSIVALIAFGTLFDTAQSARRIIEDWWYVYGGASSNLVPERERRALAIRIPTQRPCTVMSLMQLVLPLRRGQYVLKLDQLPYRSPHEGVMTRWVWKSSSFRR